MSINPFSHLRSQIKGALEREAKLSPHERKMHQWQFLTTVNEVVYIVGKGGANTMFYCVGVNGERNICTPSEMLDIISIWSGAKFPMYAIGKKKDSYSHGPTPDLDSLLEEDPSVGSFIVGLTHDGKAIRLHKYVDGIMGTKWVKFKK